MSKEKIELSDEDLEEVSGGGRFFLGVPQALKDELEKMYGMKLAGYCGGNDVKTLCGGYGCATVRSPKSSDDTLIYEGVSYHPVFARVGWYQVEVIWSADDDEKTFLLPSGMELYGM